MTDFIIDASVAAKWLLDEPDSVQARRLISPDIYLRAPELVVPELTNILLKKQLRGDLTAERAVKHLAVLMEEHLDVTIHLIPDRMLSKRALEIACSTGRSAYDCLYLAAAVQAGCCLITADDRFTRSIKNRTLRAHIVALSEMLSKRFPI